MSCPIGRRRVQSSRDIQRGDLGLLYPFGSGGKANQAVGPGDPGVRDRNSSGHLGKDLSRRESDGRSDAAKEDPSFADGGCVARDRRFTCHEETEPDRPEEPARAAAAADEVKAGAAWAAIAPVRARRDSAFVLNAGNGSLTPWAPRAIGWLVPNAEPRWRANSGGHAAECRRGSMKVHLDCLPCFFRQALDVARRATDDERIQRAVLDRVSSAFPAFPLNVTPIEVGRDVYRIAREVTGVDDPYREAKRADNERVAALLPRLRARVEASADPLRTAFTLAAAGNLIDFGARSTVDLDHAIAQGLEDGKGMVDYPRLKERLASVDEVLYLGDNAGEIVLDKLVVERLADLGKRVTFVVRGRPIINDATVEDAAFVGMEDVADVVSSGSDGPGTALRSCRPDFVDAFRRANLILSKGQGNFEGLSDENAPLFFLLTVKCPVVARELRTEIGMTVLRAQETDGKLG